MNIFNLPRLDLLSLAAFILGWLYLNYRIESVSERNHRRKRSTHELMKDFRYRWLYVATKRDNRIVDATILSSLQQSTRFFISSTIIAIGGMIALVTQSDKLVTLAHLFATTPLPQNAQMSELVNLWEMKLLFTTLILAIALLSFIWSSRLFGYCAVVFGAIPVDVSDAETEHVANQAAALNVSAARNFNRGLRAIYFALASLAWLLGSLPFLLATIATFATLYRREFASKSRSILMETYDDKSSTRT